MISSFTTFLGILTWSVLVTLPVGAMSVFMHFLLSLPMQRRDHARFFLDLLETALDRGQPVEQSILCAAESRDRSMGVKFFMMAAYIEDGLRLGNALEKVPTFLPPQVNAMLQTGEKTCDFKKVLPACREVLRVAPDTVRNTMHYMIAITMVFAPICIWMITVLMLFVVPKFKDIFAGMGIKIWEPALIVFHFAPQLIFFEISVFLILLVVAIVYFSGPGLVRWFQFCRLPVVDWVAWRVPWKRKKLLGAFSAMLAVLLDGGVPEADAVRLAGESTANEICRRRARRVIVALEHGEKLAEAVRTFDDTGEFHWRLANALHARGRFLEALRGWHAALDARAFQQEETATHLMTSGLVILNGLIVGLIAIGMFGMLVMLLREAVGST